MKLDRAPPLADGVDGPAADRRWSPWEPAAPDVATPTPESARTLILECFFHAQRATFLRTKERLGSTRLDDASIRADVIRVVRLAFTETGGEFEHPTAESLRRVIAFLARNAEAWGTPPEIVDDHRRKMVAVLERLDAE